MGAPGIEAVRRVLPDLKKSEGIDFVIAQAENVSDGRSMSLEDMKTLQDLGIDFFTGGNHTPKQEELKPLLEDISQPVIGPANMPSCPGRGWKFAETSAGRVMVISLLGTTVGREVVTTNPLQKIDQLLAANQDEPRIATIVNFHGDYSSEKRVIGYYLDGRVNAVIGDHWHVPTADAMVLPNGTGHITDVGMCGTLHSSLGVKVDIIVNRWRDKIINKNELETAGPLQFNAVLLEAVDGISQNINHIQRILA
jgi:metallophosphoesterase (TIGR00282 family)